MRELWLRLLVRLQADSVRRTYGDDWLATARQRDADAEQRGPWALGAHRCREGLGAVRAAWRGRVGRFIVREEVGRMETWIQDVRYGARSLVRARGFTVVAVTVLGVGIAATTTIFSGVHAVLLAPLPFDEPDRLVGLWERNPDFGWDQADAAPANVLDWRERVEAFDDVAAYRGSSLGGVTWTGDGGPRQLTAIEVTGNLFSVLGVQPLLGTLPDFDDSWAGGEGWVVVSHGFWSEALGGDPDAVGRSLELDGAPARIRAVLPPGVRFPAEGVDLWRPYAWNRAARDEAWFRRAHFVTPIARLAPGVRVERARAELDAVALQLQREHPTLNSNMFAGLTPLRAWLAGDLAGPLRMLMAAVGVLLLLACVNVGNLFAVRAVGRADELAIRRAVGAGSIRIARQLLVESLLIGAAGGALGIALSVGGIRVLSRLRPLGIAGATEVELNGAVLVFAVGVSLAAALLFGLGPALRAARGTLARKRGVRASLGQGLIPVQTALAVVLVLAAALVTRSFARLQGEDSGVDPEGVWTFELSAPAARYQDVAGLLGFWSDIVERIEAIPGVRRAAVTSGIPLTFAGWTSQLVARDWAPGELAFEVRHRTATPGYFDVMGVPLIEGRGFAPGDGLDGPPVAIVNQTFVATHFAGEAALGREITFDREPTENSVWRTVVGVVADERQRSLGLPPDPEVWEPFPQDIGRTRQVVVRFEGDTEGLRPALAAAVHDVDGGVPLPRLRSMDSVVEAASADAAFLMLLFGLFAALALVLAAVGIYGVTAQAVRRRVPELGVRLALGARSGEVVRLVLVRALVLAGTGVVVGAVVALVGAGVLESLLYQTPPRDRLAFIVAPALLLGVALVAAWVPARRAARVDPVRSLWAE